MPKILQNVTVKICGLTTVSDVALAAELEADFFGFIVYPKSPRGLSLSKATELAAIIPHERRVIVDVGTDPEGLARYRDAGFGRFQMHAPLPLNTGILAKWSATVGRERLWLAPRVAPSDVFPEECLPLANTILLDTYSAGQIGGTGKTGDWGRFAEWRQAYPDQQLVLAGGLTPGNIVEAITATGASHVDVNSGVESAPGKKDPKKLRELFRILRSS